jgi:hypothetical protein
MLAQNEDMAGVFKSMFWHLKIRITTQCNLKCRHCYAPYEAQPIDYPIDPAITKPLIEDPAVKYVHLQGGEPMLYPEVVAQAAALCRGVKPFCVFTNGTWIRDADKLAFFLKEIKPTFLCVSSNKYMAEQVPIYDIVNEALDIWKDNPDTKIMTTALIDASNLNAMHQFAAAGGWPPYNPKWFPEIESHFKYPFFKFMLPLCSGGRGAELADDLPRINWPGGFLACTFSTAINPDGKLYGDCGATSTHCYLGHISEYGKQPVTEILRRRKNILVVDKRALNGMHQICEEKKLHCFKGI